jgi:hypothetical protein
MRCSRGHSSVCKELYVKNKSLRLAAIQSDSWLRISEPPLRLPGAWHRSLEGSKELHIGRGEPLEFLDPLKAGWRLEQPRPNAPMKEDSSDHAGKN